MAEIESSREPTALAHPSGTRHPLRRVLGYARPMWGILILTSVMALGISVSNMGRAYLLKPIFDDILLPNHMSSRESYAPDWLRGIPLIGIEKEEGSVRES